MRNRKENIKKYLPKANPMPSGRLCVVPIATLKFAGLRLWFKESLSVAPVARQVVLAIAITHFITQLLSQV
jgi:hypothetical protein